MAGQSSNVEFQFVNSTINTPLVPQDLAIRALIRKQAMKKASASRRRDGNYGKHNLRQYPVFLFDQSAVGGKPSPADYTVADEYGYPVEALTYRTVLDDNSAKDKDIRVKSNKHEKSRINQQRWLARIAIAESLPPNLSAKGYDLAIMKSGFDILDLSNLASLHVGRAARQTLSTNPYQLIHQLRNNKPWSYLLYIPGRYGHIPCLNDATDCVIARARQIVCPSENMEAKVITSYVKALDSLQRALDNPKLRYKPDVLCATEILALYEFLDPSGETAWIRHAAGAARLIQLRGPENYKTEFEKALFMAHTGAMMTEALLNGERCFLEQDPWQAVFRSIVDSSMMISDRSQIFISLLLLKSRIPGTFVDVTNIIYKKSDQDESALEDAAYRTRKLRSDLASWHDDYQRILSFAPEICPGSIEYDRRCKIFATYLSCVMISSRLLGAISSADRPKLEKETLAYGRMMLDLEIEVKSASAQTHLFMAQTVGVARATIATSPDWIGCDPEVNNEKVETIALWRFEKWCSSFGRKLP